MQDLEQVSGKKEGIVYLRGKKTILRPPSKSKDLELFLKWFNDPDGWVFLGRIEPMYEAAETEWFDKVHERKNSHVFTIETAEGEAIGTMGVHNIDWIHRTCSTGAYIGRKDFWGKGYGSDAKMALLKWLFDQLGMYKVYSNVIGFNGRSVAYSLKCGYVQEGVLPKHLFRNGKRHDLIQLAAYRPRFIKIWRRWEKTGKL